MTLSLRSFSSWNASRVGTLKKEGGENIIGIGSYSRLPNTDLAEVALVVRDDWQNKGLGTKLFNYLAEIAQKMEYLDLLHGLWIKTKEWCTYSRGQIIPLTTVMKEIFII